MSCDPNVGRLLAALASSRPGGNLLELGTGVGVGTAWLGAGLHPDARLVTVELNAALQDVARTELGDARISFVRGDAAEWIETYDGPRFDLIFVDTWPGKFSHLEQTLALIEVGRWYVVDDMTPRPHWATDHAAGIDALAVSLRNHQKFRVAALSDGSGVMVAARRCR